MEVEQGKAVDIGEVPWWAVALLENLTDDEHRVRSNLQGGDRCHISGPLADRWWSAYATLVAKARRLEDRRPLTEWITQAYNETDHGNILSDGGPTTRALRDAALSGVRAFSQIIGLTDDDDMPLVFEDFHVKTVIAMRSSEMPASILLPFQFGKSVLSSEIVPLMDWCEWAQATEGRVYHAENHVTKWIGRLMQHVEHNDNIHRVFPWVAKPVKGDVCWGIWSTEGFAIRGRTRRDKSFEPLTIAAGKTGLRYHRMGVDDVVVSKEAASLPVQERNFQYLTTGVFTTKQRTARRKSRYGTVFPGLYIVGTLFEMTDVNYRMDEYFRFKNWRTVKYDIYPRGKRAAKEEGVTLWPRVMPYAACAALEEELGPAAFEKRCRNRVRAAGAIAFPIEQLRAAESDRWKWGVVPQNTRAMIGFDPGSGKITKWSKNPAVVVYGEQDLTAPFGPKLEVLQDASDTGGDPAAREELDYWANTLVHIIESHRLRGYTFPRQCEFLADLATRLGIPIAVEDNHIQSAYGEEINRRFPWVRTICHTTSDNKRDPRDGVETFAPLFERQRIVIHAVDAPAENIANLRTEFSQWPGGHNTDLVMAAWIAKFQTFHERGNRRVKSFPSHTLPAYARGFSGRRRFRLVGSG
jgi:hypothetical protein